MTTFYIVRHGQTQWNIEKLLQGHKDSPLTAQGRQEAQALARQLVDIPLVAIFSSDLLRALRTAKIIAVEKKITVQTTPLVRERNFGAYEGRPREDFLKENKELIEKFSTLAGQEQADFKYAPDIENNQELMRRLATFLREVAGRYGGQAVLVVTHGGVMRALLNHLNNPLARGLITNGAVIILESDGVDLAIKETKGITSSTRKYFGWF